MGTSSNTEVFFVRTGENINRIETRRQKIKSLKHLEKKKEKQSDFCRDLLEYTESPS